MKRFAALLPLLCLGVLASANPAAAGAWPQAEGTGQLITTLATSTSDTGFDGRDSGRTLEFRKWELTPYFAYGVGPDSSLFLKPTIQRLSADRTGGGTDHTSGLTDTEVGGTFALWRGEGAVFSLQPMVRLPFFYDKDDSPALGSGHVDLEMRALYGTNLTLMGLPGFFDGQTAWRQRTGAPADEASLDLTLGLRPNADWMVLLQNFNTISVGDAGPGYGDFRRYKAQLSVVRQLTRDVGLQVGVNQAIGGRNDGDETGFLLALWLDF